MRKKSFNYLLIGIAVVAVAPLLLRLAGGYWLHVLILIGIYGSLAVGLNLLLGYTGQISIAHISFFGIGAYTSALLVMRLGVNFWLTIPIASIAALIVGFVVGCVSLRLRGTYFALTTFAFLMVIKEVFTSWRSLTQGAMGLFPIPQASIGGLTLGPGQKLIWAYIALAFLLFTVFVVDSMINSRIGRALIAIREDEDLAKSTGINTFWYKMLSFNVGCFLAGMAGALYSTYIGIMTPGDCGVLPTAMLIAACVIGGLGTMLGPVIGVIVIQVLPELLRPLSLYYMLIFGGLVVAIILFVPQGIIGSIKSLQNWLRARSSKGRSLQ